MEKLIKILVALTLVFFAFGCGSEEVAEENGNNNGEQDSGEVADEYEPVSGEPVMEGLIVMEIRNEGQISTYRYLSELNAEESQIQVEAWAEANDYEIVDEDLSEMIVEDEAYEIDKSLINVTITPNYEEYDNETLVQIRMFQD